MKLWSCFTVLAVLILNASGSRAQCDVMRSHIASTAEELIEYSDLYQSQLMTCLELDSFQFLWFKNFISNNASNDGLKKKDDAGREGFELDTLFIAFNQRVLKNRMYPFLKMAEEPIIQVMSLPVSVSETELQFTLQEGRFSQEESATLIEYWRENAAKYKSMEGLYRAHVQNQLEKKEAEENKRKQEFASAWGLNSIEDIHLLHNFPFFDELGPAKEYAQKSGRPLLVCFTGFTVVNGVKMQEGVLAAPVIQELLRDDFILVLLRLDDRRVLPKEEQRTELVVGKPFDVKTYGDKWTLLELNMFNAGALPLFFKSSYDLVPIGTPMKYTSSVEEFRAWLEGS